MLTCTEWDAALEAAKAARTPVAGLLGVRVPAAGGVSGAGMGDGTAAHGAGEKTTRRPDELESYKSLVKTTGF